MQGQTKERATLLWMWGRGREGQLGADSLADSALPCLVPALRTRQVLQVRIRQCHCGSTLRARQVLTALVC